MTFKGNVLKYPRYAKTLGKQSGLECLQERGSWWKPSARIPQATSFALPGMTGTGCSRYRVSKIALCVTADEIVCGSQRIFCPDCAV